MQSSARKLRFKGDMRKDLVKTGKNVKNVFYFFEFSGDFTESSFFKNILKLFQIKRKNLEAER